MSKVTDALTLLDTNYKASLNMDLSEYRGEWVAIRQKTVLAHDRDLKKIYSKLENKYDIKEIFFTRIPEKGVRIL